MSDVRRSGVDQDNVEEPLGQRLYDNWVLLLIAGILIMAVIYTGWGLLEVINIPKAELP